MVIFLFLRSASATVIPSLAVPVSLIGTCAAMYAFGFSINNMTLLALTLSVGFVVDDAIVMLENIVRHIEGGMRPFEAALKGARDTGFILAISEGPTDVSFAGMVERQRKLVEVILKDSAVDYLNSTVGAGGPNPTTNYGRAFIALKPRAQRDHSTVVIQRLRREVSG